MDLDHLPVESGLGRRTFLKGTAVVGGAAGFYLAGTHSPGQVLLGLETDDRGAGPSALVPEKVYDAVCYPNCPGKCPSRRTSGPGGWSRPPRAGSRSLGTSASACAG